MERSLFRPALCAAVLVMAAGASAETLTVNLAADTTFAAWLAAESMTKADLAGYTEIALSGAGHLTVADELVGYAGDVRIAAGSWMRVTCPTNGLGTTAGTTYVADGGTLEFHTPSKENGYFRAYARPIHFAGAGVDGKGALRYSGTLGHDSPRDLYSTRLFMDGDAKIAATHQDDWQAGTVIDMNFHTLDYASAGGRFMGVSITHPGHINVVSGTPLIQSNTNLGGGPTNVFTVKSNAGLKWWGQSGGLEWKLVCEPNVRFIAGEGTCGWGGPVELQGDCSCTRQNANAMLSFPTYVTGPGGFRRYAYWGGLENDMRLRFGCATNDFQGGIGFNRDLVLPLVNGALPAAGGALALTNGTVQFTENLTYALPAYICHGTGLVQNANGSWKKVTKDGAGDLVYNSRVGAPALEVRQGAVRFSVAEKGFLEHLFVADASYGDAAARLAAAQALYYGTETPVTRVCTGTGYLYENVYSSPKHWQDYSTYVLSGYLWNRTESDVTWTFALCYDDSSRLFVNDVMEIEQIGWQTPATKAVTLKPGANRIVLRIYNGTGGGGASTHAGWQSKAFSYYEGVTDAKEASAFTAFTAAKIAEVFTPHDGTADAFMKVAPVFPSVVCAPGTVVDTLGASYVVADLTGAGAFTNGSLVVTNTLALAAADLNAGRALAVSGTLTLGEGAVVDVPDPESLVRAAPSLVVATAASVSGLVRGSERLRAASWFATADAGAIRIYHAKGTSLIVR